MTKPDSPTLYWAGGPFHVFLQYPSNMSDSVVNGAIASLDAFRSDCQRQFCAFSGTVNGRILASSTWKPPTPVTIRWRCYRAVLIELA